MNRFEKKALSMLPQEFAKTVSALAGLHGGCVHEIRLRLDKPLVITVGEKNYASGTICTKEAMEVAVKNLCKNSMYAHYNTICDGYIDAGDGIRAGVCGQAIVENGRISLIKDISSISIRIPRRVKGAADCILDIIQKKDYHANILIYSKPGVGKTTILRELAAGLSSGINAKRVAIVDTRSEIGVDLEEAMMLDKLSGYPRAAGIETAVRTLSPQFIICDEIITKDDAEAIITAFGSGVNLCASIHAECYESLTKQPIMQMMNEYNIFDTIVGLIPAYDSEKRYCMEIRSTKG